MNERIQELYEQAHIERRQEYFSSVVDPTIKSVSVTRHFDPNKFAELIVAECMEQVWYTREDGINGNISQVIKDRIKQHFGVK
jgi:hypothetical protein